MKRDGKPNSKNYKKNISERYMLKKEFGVKCKDRYSKLNKRDIFE
jgi:hypothetical protein